MLQQAQTSNLLNKFVHKFEIKLFDHLQIFITYYRIILTLFAMVIFIVSTIIFFYTYTY
ncbi:hypothetical protein J2S11_003672 [Bacillus horti]|uniref:Uncharacterized protein n=1 Tax=Caldalkalibacillus horti TaxID=77523 RepID=A0ABT9W4G3_9BACI|nr:hypothetical protein [Bacillus horti]